MKQNQEVKYYTVLDTMKKRFDASMRKNRMDASDLSTFLAWRDKAKEELHGLLCLDRMETCNLDEELISSEKTEDGIRREKYVIQTEPGIFMPFYVLYPKEEDKQEKSCAIALAGHLGAGKESIAGRFDLPMMEEAIKKYKYDYGLELAKMGHITICPDPRGFSERREMAMQGFKKINVLNGSCTQLSHMAEPLGQTVLGMFVWDLIRLVDFIEKKQFAGIEELSCVGFSGGGMQALYHAVLDERIKKVIVSGYFYGVKDSFIDLNGNCACNYVPHMFEHFDMGDIGAMLAPRPFLIQSAKEDHLNGKRGMINVLEQVAVVKEAYQLCGKTESLVHDLRDGGHCFHKECLSFFEA